MKTIKILGTGCSKCKQTEAVVRDVLARTGIEATIEKVEDLQAIMAYNVMTTPTIVIDDNIVFKGRVPTESEMQSLLG
jgi:small redox-active disulfide protein 2